MSALVSVPWHQYGLLAYLACRLQELNVRFGKTALQKLVYLIQEIYCVPCGYQFTLHHHGPFSSELAGDLDYVEALGAVSVSFRKDGYVGYLIEPGERCEDTKARASQFVDQYKEKIEEVITCFGRYAARDLELISTTLFVERDTLRKNGIAPARTWLSEKVHALKPRYSGREIYATIAELERLKLIKVTNG